MPYHFHQQYFHQMLFYSYLIFYLRYHLDILEYLQPSLACYFNGEENDTCIHTNNPLLESSTIWFVEKVSKILNPSQM
jgi:hypothetical protein